MKAKESFIRKFNHTLCHHLRHSFIVLLLLESFPYKHSFSLLISHTFWFHLSIHIDMSHITIFFHFSQIQPYHQRTFGERHHQSSATVGHTNNNISTTATLIPAGNQFIRGHTYRRSDTSELSEKNHHISSMASMNSRHFESLMTSTHHVTSSAYDKIFQ